MRRLILPAVLLATALAGNPLSALPAQAGATSQTLTIHNGTDTFVDVNPCTGDPATRLSSNSLRNTDLRKGQQRTPGVCRRPRIPLPSPTFRLSWAPCSGGRSSGGAKRARGHVRQSGYLRWSSWNSRSLNARSMRATNTGAERDPAVLPQRGLFRRTRERRGTTTRPRPGA